MDGGREAISPRIRQWWDTWTKTITEERRSTHGSERLRGFFKQLLTEFVVNSAVAISLAIVALIIHNLTPFVIYPNIWISLPGGFVGTVVLLFIISHDTWIRNPEEGGENEP